MSILSILYDAIESLEKMLHRDNGMWNGMETCSKVYRTRNYTHALFFGFSTGLVRRSSTVILSRPLGYLLLGDPPNVCFFVSGSSRIRNHEGIASVLQIGIRPKT